MKKIVLALTAVVITFSAMAQKGKKSKEWKQDKIEQKADRKDDDGGGRGQGKKGEVSEELGLNEQQKSQMKEINENFRKQMQEINKNESLSQEQKKEKRQAILREKKEKMAAVLTTEQKEKFKSIRKEHKDDKGEGKGRGRGKGDKRFGGTNFNDFTKDLNLTPQQSASIASLNGSFKTRLNEIKSNTTLSEDQRKDEMRTAIKNHRSSIQDLLTAEQKDQLKRQMKNHSKRKNVK